MKIDLTDEERASLFDVLPTDLDSPFLLLDTVERIVAARLAAVEALADEWERQASDPTDPAYKIGLFSAAGELRDALRADSSEAPAQPWAGPVAALREGRVRPGLPARPDPDSSEAPA